MSILKGYIAEELERLERIEKGIIKTISALPAGVIQKRVINGREYGYLKYYEDGKTKQKYIGPYNSNQVQETNTKIEERKEFEQSLLRIRQEKQYGNNALSAKVKASPNSVRVSKLK